MLELEQTLQQERMRLGALRKKHYELAGVKEDEDEEDASDTEVSNLSMCCNYVTEPTKFTPRSCLSDTSQESGP